MIVPAPTRVLTALAVVGALGIALQADLADSAPKEKDKASTLTKDKAAATKAKTPAAAAKGKPNGNAKARVEK